MLTTSLCYSLSENYLTTRADYITVLFIMLSLHSGVLSHTQVNDYKRMSWPRVLFVKQANKSETVDGVTIRILHHFVICFMSICKLVNVTFNANKSRPVINVCYEAEIYKDQVPSNSLSSVRWGDDVCKCCTERVGGGRAQLLEQSLNQKCYKIVT